MITANITGAADIARTLKAVGKKVREGAALEALVHATDSVINDAKAFAGRSKDSGLLQESIGLRIRRYNRGNVLFAVVGPRSGFKRLVSRDGKPPEMADPRKYASLVEYGHRVAQGGKLTRTDGKGRKGKGRVAGFAPARPFMRPAWLKNKTAVLDTFGEEFGAAVMKEAQKRAAKRKAKA